MMSLVKDRFLNLLNSPGSIGIFRPVRFQTHSSLRASQEKYGSLSSEDSGGRFRRFSSPIARTIFFGLVKKTTALLIYTATSSLVITVYSRTSALPFSSQRRPQILELSYCILGYEQSNYS